MLACAMPSATQNVNFVRTARRAVLAVALGRKRRPGRPTVLASKHKRQWRRVFLIEAWTSSGSTFAKQVASQGGSAIRVVLPRYQLNMLRKLKRLTLVPRTLRSPPPPPKIVKGRTAAWELDLRVPSHIKAFQAYIKGFQPPAWVEHVHFHTSPPCHPMTPVHNFNKHLPAECPAVTFFGFCVSLHY